MSRVNIREQILNLIAYLVIQWPLLYRTTLFDKAFAFFYVGFLLLLPFTLSRIYLLFIGFFSGLTVDILSNTPGIHASACVLIMFARNEWLSAVHDDLENLVNINCHSLGMLTFLVYAFPLILVHHILIFAIENGGLHLFVLLFTKIILSSFFSFTIIFILNYLMSSKIRRV